VEEIDDKGQIETSAATAIKIAIRNLKFGVMNSTRFGSDATINKPLIQYCGLPIRLLRTPYPISHRCCANPAGRNLQTPVADSRNEKLRDRTPSFTATFHLIRDWSRRELICDNGWSPLLLSNRYYP
jgi:hypothetical protein